MKPSLQLLLGLLWLCAVITGTGALLVYEYTPGTQAAPNRSWPTQSTLSRAADKPTLIMFAHPRCPCTQVALNELAHILELHPGKAQAAVLFMVPADLQTDPQWTQTSLWTAAGEMNDVTPRIDVDGAQAALFGATTSGHVFLYSPSGDLLFSGAVTASRGHAGPSIGQASIINLLNSQTPQAAQTPVYGCSLSSPSSTCLNPEGQCIP